MIILMTSIVEWNNRLRTESNKLPRAKKEDEEEGEPPVKLYIEEGHDDTWSTIHNGARNIRQFCGDWTSRYKSLGRKAKPAKESLD